MEVSEYRKLIFALRSKLSSETDKRITGVSSELHYNEKLYFEDLMRRAAGNSFEEPTDLSLNHVAAFEKVWNTLKPMFETATKVRTFEERFLQPLLSDDEASIPETWRTLFVSRLSEATTDKMMLLYRYYDKELNIPIAQIGKAAYLQDPGFRHFEERAILPSLDRAIEKAIEDELLANGLGEKKRLKSNKVDKSQNSIPSMLEKNEVVKSYIKAVESHKKPTPTIEEIAEIESRPISTISKRLSEISVLSDIYKEVKKKRNLAKKDERIELWTTALVGVEDKIQKASAKLRKQRERQYDDDKAQEYLDQS